MSEQADSTTLSAIYVVTADDLVVTNRIGERGVVPTLYIAAGMGAVVGAVGIGWHPIIGVLGIGLCIVIATLPRLPTFWRWWLTRQGGEFLGKERRFTFDAEGLHEEYAGIRYTTPWSLLTAMRVTRDGIFLLHNRLVVLALPSRAFSSPDDVDLLIDLVSANASRVRVT